jgi:hypothetical protein
MYNLTAVELSVEVGYPDSVDQENRSRRFDENQLLIVELYLFIYIINYYNLYYSVEL